MKMPVVGLRTFAWFSQWLRRRGRSSQFRLLLLAALAALGLGGIRQTPPSAGDLLQRMGSWPEFTRGPALDVSLAGHYAYVAIGEGGLAVIDITDPAKPKRAGTYLAPGRTERVLVADARAYLATNVHRGGGCEAENWRGHLVILDVSDPANPTLLGTYITGTSITSLQVDGNRVYLGDADPTGHGERSLHIVDVSNPARPVTLGVDRTSGADGGLAVVGDRAYLASFDLPKDIHILDVSQPGSPAHVAAIKAEGRIRGIQVAGNLLYAILQFEPNLLIYDIGNTAAPQVLSRFGLGDSALDLKVFGGHAYVAMANAGLVVVDISNPSMPAIAGTWDTPGVAVRVELAGGNAFVADHYGGLQVIDVRDPAGMVSVASYDTGLTTRAVRVFGGRAYLLSSDRPEYGPDARSRVEILDVSEPTQPALLGAYESTQMVECFDIAGGLAYLPTIFNGVAKLQIVGLNNPEAPVLLNDTTITPPGGALHSVGIRVSGVYAYLTEIVAAQPTAFPRLRIFDVSDPAKIMQVSQTNLSGSPIGALRIAGDYLYLNSLGALLEFNVAEPKAPALLRTIYLANSSGDSGGLHVSDDFAYAGQGWKGFSIVYLRNPKQPAEIGRYDTLGQVQDLSVDDRYVYVAEGWEGVEVFDAGNPARPLPIGRSPNRGKARGIEVSGDYAYVAEGGGGLAILSLAPESVSIVEEPATLRVAAGDAATFTVCAFGRGPLVYQWYAGERGDVSQPIPGANNPTFTTPPLTGSAAFWVRVSHAKSAIDSRTARVNLAQPVSVELLGLWANDGRSFGFARDVAVSGQNAFLADEERGLRILDVSHPAQPKLLATYSSGAVAAAADGPFVYVVAKTLQVLDLSDPARPSVITNFTATPGLGDARDVFPADGFAYFLSGGGTKNAGLKMIDMRNPAAPKIIASNALSPQWDQAAVMGMAFAGSYAALGQNWGGLQILDLTVPSDPKWSGAYYSDAPVWDVAWFGRFACVTTGPELPGLEVIDMTDFHRPTRVAKVPLALANNVALMGSYACVTGIGLRIFDLADPFQPVLVGSHQFGPDSETRGLQVVGNLVYVAAGAHGLAIYRLTPQLRLDPPVWDGKALRLSWLGAPGIRLQRATSLSAPDWQDVPGSDGASSMELSRAGAALYFRLLKP